MLCYVVRQLMATNSALDGNVNNNADSSELCEPDSHVELPSEVPSVSVCVMLIVWFYWL